MLAFLCMCSYSPLSASNRPSSGMVPQSFKANPFLCERCGIKFDCCSAGGSWESLCTDDGQYTYAAGLQLCNAANRRASNKFDAIPPASWEEFMGQGEIYDFGICDEPDETAPSTTKYVNPLFGGLDELEWMRLPPGTHLLLFGTSHVSLAASTLRAGLHYLGAIDSHEVLAMSECDAPGEAMIEGTHTHSRTAIKGNSSITVIVNMGQYQRKTAGHALDALLSQTGFTHGAFMPPHDDAYFDAQCEKENTGKMPNANEVGDLAEKCGSKAGPYCVMQHPLYGVVAKHIPSVATILRPDGHCFSPEETEQIAPRCVSDAQINSQECNGNYNKTVWMQAGYGAYSEQGATYEPKFTCDGQGAFSALPLNPVGAHMCQMTCRTGRVHCHAAPGLLSLWLILRAAGLGKVELAHSHK